MLLFVYVTYPDEATARRVGEALVQRRLAACSNVFPASSTYFWQGALQHDNEWIGLLKTFPALETDLEAALRAEHPYEVPCIVRWEVRANADYEQWVEGCLGGQGFKV